MGITTLPPTSTTVHLTAKTSRALLVGDSTLLALDKYKALSGLRDFQYVYDSASCRTLGIVSCGSRPKPKNTVRTIEDSPGPFDVVVVMAGYDEWWTSFPSSFEQVIAAARAQGAQHILWLTYREGVGYENPSGQTASEAFVKNNETLRSMVSKPEYADVTLLDWFGYTATKPQWLADDGIHLTLGGAFGVADYISRMIAHLDERACPGSDVSAGVCPNPDTVGPDG